MATCLTNHSFVKFMWDNNYDYRDETDSEPEITDITVAIQLSWDTKTIAKVPPRPYIATVPKGTVLKTILNKAAMANSAYAYTCWYFPGLGDVITSIDGVYQDNSERKYWMAYESSEQLTLSNIDTFQPEHGSTITFGYESQCDCTSS